MINSDNGIGFTGGGVPNFHKQQSPIGAKKSVLRDLQNDSIKNSEETLGFSEGKNGCRISGVKRLATECPSNPNNVVSKQFTYARKKTTTETEATKPVTPHWGCFIQKQQNQIGLIAKPGNGVFGVEQDSLRVSTEIPPPAAAVCDQRSKERPEPLLIYLNKCSEFDRRDYTKMLVHLGPGELSRHAVELEKRAIQLTMEEGKEIERMKQLNILSSYPILGKTKLEGLNVEMMDASFGKS